MVVTIFGLDGASLNQLDSATRRTHLPNFEKLLHGGNVSNLISVYPYVTAPAWTSMFSGVNPGKHGIFEMFEIAGDQIIPSNMRKTDVPLLWDYLSWARKKVLVLGVPFVYPAPKVNGSFVTGRFVPKLSCFPENLKQKYDLSGFEYQELPTEQGIEMRISQGTREVSLQLIQALQLRIKTALSMIDSDAWDSVILVDNLPDEVLHISYGDTETLDTMFAALDGFLGNLLKRLGPRDHLLVVSDHGFSGVKSIFFMNEWLRSRKYLVIHESIFSKSLNLIGLNWDRLSQPGLFSSLYKTGLKYFPGLLRFTKNQASSGFLISDDLKIRSRVGAFGINEPVGWIRVSAPENNKVNLIYRQLMELKNEGILKNVFKAEEIFHGKYVGNVIGQLIVEAREESAIDTTRLNGGKLEGKPLLTKKGVHEQAGLIGYIGESKINTNLKCRIQDVVPTVLVLMSLPIPNNIDGLSIMTRNDKEIPAWKLNVAESF